jgi:hypothetical protein
MPQRPIRGEIADYFFTYADQVGEGDIREILRAQTDECVALFSAISEEQSLGRYAEDKWSIREVLGHINDTERMFAFRAFWFARGFTTPLPSFDQTVAVATAGAHERGWSSHVDEFRIVRAASVALFDHLADDAWARRGIASDKPFTVSGLAYIMAGHVTHHSRILRERYLTR